MFPLLLGAVFNTELTQFIGADDSQSELRIQLNSTIPMTSYDVYTTSSVSPEFINYLFALLIYSLRYPSVFWYTKKSFGMIFSCYLVLTTAHALFTFCSVSVLYKFQVNNSWFTGVSLVLPHGAVLALHIIAGWYIAVRWWEGMGGGAVWDGGKESHEYEGWKGDNGLMGWRNKIE